MRETGLDPGAELAAARLRRRLWGATVLIALAVLVLPLLLDGSGSESRFRRVERLREEPPRLVGETDGARDAGVSVDATAAEPALGEAVGRPAGATDATADAEAGSGTAAPVVAGAADRSEPARAGATPAGDGTDRDRASLRRGSAALPAAWVVRAGSFGAQDGAVALRDSLREAGYPSFVTETGDASPLYRVQVGPLVDQGRAEATRAEIVVRFGIEPVVVPYP